MTEPELPRNFVLMVAPLAALAILPFCPMIEIRIAFAFKGSRFTKAFRVICLCASTSCAPLVSTHAIAL